MRLAIIGTPRSGNVWLRSILSTTLGLPPFAEHNWTSYPDPLPEKCIIGIHWYREPNFQDYLRRNGFRTIVLARHPLDVMLSVLSFSSREPAIAQWLGGNADVPPSMYGADPTSDAFIGWTTSFGAENLLSVSYQWWNDPGTIRVAYENLLREPTETVGQIAHDLHTSFNELGASLAENSFDKFKALPNRHGWQGVAGLHQSLMTQQTASAIHARHRQVFDILGYDSVVGETVTTESVRQAWARLS